MSTAPDRSLQQRRAALTKATGVRVYRAQLKRDINTGHITATDVLRAPHPDVLTMKVRDLLLAVPMIGRYKAGQALKCVRAAPTKTIGGLSDRQRHELVVWLETPSPYLLRKMREAA